MCFNIINDAYVTKCGHSFCHVCIEKSLKESNRCPKCNLVIDKADQIFPNFSLNELISKYKRQERSLCKNKVSQDFGSLTSFLPEDLSVTEIDFWLNALEDRKRHLELGTAFIQHKLTMEFLHEMQNIKQQQMDRLQRELRVINEDLSKIEGCLTPHPNGRAIKSEVDLSSPTADLPCSSSGSRLVHF
jgi:E3 ubiquitin-protein ligase RFWD2